MRKLYSLFYSMTILFAGIFLSGDVSGQSNHTVTFTGATSDFNSAEKYSSVDNVDYYVTYDATYIYFGAFRTNNNSWGQFDHFVIYVDKDPTTSVTSGGGGTTTGVNWDGNTPSLPIQADYRIAIRRNGTGESFYSSYSGSWNTGSANAKGWSQFTSASSNGGLEVRIPWTDLGSPDAIYFNMYCSYSTGFFGAAPNGTSGTAPSTSKYFGGIGTTSASCIPINTTNTPITAAISNGTPASGGLYGRVKVSSGTITASNNFSIAPGGSISVSGGTLDLSGRTVTMGGSSVATGAGSTINTSSSGVLTTSSSTILNFNGEGYVTGNNLTYNGTLNTSKTFTPLASGGFTISSTGVLNIKSGGTVATNSPTYATGSTLSYNTGGSYGLTSNTKEWISGATSGAGVPYNVSIGNVTAGSTLSFGTESSYRQVMGNFNLSGTLALSTASGGDIKVAGDWNFTVGGTFTPNSRAVFFNGSSLQTITRSAAGTLNFDYLLNQNSSGGLKLATGTNIQMNATTGSALQLSSSAALDLNSDTLKLGSNVSVSISGTQSISNGVVTVAGAGAVSGTGSLSFGSDVTLVLNGGFGFGSNLTTINGTLQINNGGYVSPNAPSYGSSSTLKYNSGSVYARGIEWGTSSGAAYPNNVVISNNTTLDPGGNGNSGTTLSMAGNLTINTGSSVYMDYSSDDMTVPLIVNGNLTLDGSLSLSEIGGGDLKVRGNWSRTGTFTPQNRAVYFDGSNGNQTMTGATGFDYVIIDKSSGNLVLSNDATINQTLTITNGLVSTGTNKLIVSSTGSITRTNGWVNGNLQKWVAVGSTSGTFEVGGSTTYDPIDLSFASAVTTGGNIMATTGSGDDANENTPVSNSSGIDPANKVSRYWTLTNSGVAGFGSYSTKFTYTAAEVLGATSPTTYVVRKYDNTNGWATTTNGTRTTTSTQATGLTVFGDYVVGAANPAPTTTAPSSVAKCVGQSVTFGPVTPSNAPASYTYQWYKGTDLITGETASSYTIASVSTNDAGDYTVKVSNINGSGTSSAATLTVTTPPSATIAYDGSPYCNNGGTASVTRSGTAGGTYSSTTGLTINSTSGDINLNASTAGTYTVTYTVGASGGCSLYTTTADMTITAAPLATISYAGSPYCASGTASVSRTGTAGGSYTSTTGLIINGSTGDIDLSASTPGSYTVTYTVAAANGCSEYAITTDVTILPRPTSAATGSTTMCNGMNTTVSVSLTGSQPWSITYTDGTTPVTVNNVTSSPYTFSVGPHSTTTYTVTALSDANCTSQASDKTGSAVVTVTNNNTWLGISSNWDNPANWSCGIVPNGSTIDAYIASSSVTPTFASDITLHNIIFQSTTTDVNIAAHMLTLTGAVSGNGFFRGNSSSKLTITGTAGTIKFNNNGYTALYNLTLGAGASVTLGSSVWVYNLVTVGAGATLNSAGYLNLKSIYGTTGHVAPLTTGVITGNVVVERYIPGNAFQAWRMLAVPTQGGQTFRQGWQENQAPMVVGTTGYGTLMGHYSGTGFDYAATTGNASLKTWTPSTGTWDVTINSTNTPMQSRAGYLLYIKGDRTITPAMSTNTTNSTILRTSGVLYQGSQTSQSIPAGKYGVIGNIYPSAIDFRSLSIDTSASGFYNTYYVWDPKLYGNSGAGGYQTFSKANGWVPTPGGGSYGYTTPNTTIEQGQAFMVIARSGGGGTIGFSETAKVEHNANVFSRTKAMTRLTATLKLKGHDDPADGNTVIFATGYNETIPKPANMDENFALSIDGQSASVSVRSLQAQDGDRILYNMNNVKARQEYILELNAENFNGQQAYFEDNYLQSSTPINMDGKTVVSFTVNADTRSSAAGRFTVIFGKTASAAVISLSPGNIIVTPNPVTGTVVNLRFAGKPAGAYSLTLVNTAGQRVYTTSVHHTGNSSSYKVSLPREPGGVYHMDITAPDGKTESHAIMISN